MSIILYLKLQSEKHFEFEIHFGYVYEDCFKTPKSKPNQIKQVLGLGRQLSPYASTRTWALARTTYTQSLTLVLGKWKQVSSRWGEVLPLKKGVGGTRDCPDMQVWTQKNAKVGKNLQNNRVSKCEVWGVWLWKVDTNTLLQAGS